METERRLIDVNKVIASMQKCLDGNPDKKDSVAYVTFEALIECLKQEPIVDAVEVVRCKDCRYFLRHTKGDTAEGDCCSCGLIAQRVKKIDDFCSYGKRRKAQ